MSKLFKENREVRKTIRRVAALPFLKLEDIDDAWLTICAEKPDNSILEQFMDYVLATWIGDDEENTAKFSRVMWNHRNNFGPRTTNHIEGWHNCLNRAISKSHPNLFEFINSIKEQQANFERDVIMLDAGHNPPRRNKRYMELNKQIENLTGQYVGGQKTPMQFLDSVMDLIHLNSN